ncbi:hypothetical protein [Mycolicibacter arupensis]|uniref:Membrane protein n=1 Tax=Mycolicibacter arupensis TaxID=342002 RepID=A0A0F5MW75_9MYCO|nr:hypothetical protein [Mycolicibacter arupensis]KAA1429514.1 hypothetical protein F0402_18880 [Mycolicibacter arupensis]KKB98946.1 membrane protein [Mycolicibacter arupensis]MCV7277214.1 hypothetical protein [Mycolicibacter arupensis]OQZ98170.1 hypothetical protein BST15_09485 [Mycolicibacter arupensis]TXI58581.1 MAG: hypothetical protein E6Q54_05555 [Mycolicibacter arupensis]
MVVLSALVFTLSWWLGMYLLARDPRKPVLALAAVGLCGFAAVVAADAVRTLWQPELLGRVEIYLAVLPGVAWFAVLLELGRPCDRWTGRVRDVAFISVVATAALIGATWAGSVEGPPRAGHWLLFGVISVATLAAMVKALIRPAQPGSVLGVAAVATLFFALANAILIIPLGVVPSGIALASTGVDVLLLGVAVALWDAFDEGQALRQDMLRSFLAAVAMAALLGGQVLIGLWLTRTEPVAQTSLTVLLFTTIAVGIEVQVFVDRLAGLWDRLAFWRYPALRADRAALRVTEAALPLRSTGPLDELDEETFARLTRRALGHYGDLSKLVASPLTALPVIDERLAARGAPDAPLERANELKALLADRIAALKPRDGGEFGTTEQWRHYNALYFPYVVGVRAYAQNATAAGLDPTARQAWQWLVTEVPQRSLHNWQNAGARVIAADLRGRMPVSSGL